MLDLFDTPRAVPQDRRPVVALSYSIEVMPSHSLMGEAIAAVLRCSASADVRGAMTFDHLSLVVDVDTVSLAEPLVVFPNRHAIEAGGRLIRLASTGGIEDLSAGDERTRVLDLLPLFPVLLNVGGYAIAYLLEEAEPPVRPSPAIVETVSGPEVIPLLIAHLEATTSGIRSRAAELLAQMTAQDFGYRADGPEGERQEAVARWATWWQQSGARLSWNFRSDGATFGLTPDPPPADMRSYHLGGIAYPGNSI